jgi:glycine cleavage system H protein
MIFPEALKYSTEHTWVRIHGDRATVGITDFAQSWIGSLVSIDLFEEGCEIEPLGLFGVLETSKISFELYSPIGGIIIKRNHKLRDRVTLINDEPYGEGWMVVLQMKDIEGLTNLMDAEVYQEYIKKWRNHKGSHE